MILEDKTERLKNFIDVMLLEIANNLNNGVEKHIIGRYDHSKIGKLLNNDYEPCSYIQQEVESTTFLGTKKKVHEKVIVYVCEGEALTKQGKLNLWVREVKAVPVVKRYLEKYNEMLTSAGVEEIYIRGQPQKESMPEVPEESLLEKALEMLG
ncbi:hypothetical protein HOK51_11400 [Candidatus Woesearchaeota archaeon]|jgi:hypothetical protein|nr:hypothetical protein [Candidatus Woesearchaeota archaeon]MBT6520427.1 hypothetical protein [Candidatus Woesearchaeota archaeon]MBT7368833.1 hypothetical protein [Candidatus Woesearchaeota archaeon]